ncbi:MAG: CotH kinase family protein, partial [Verrucomicrobiae bacterium]|nr:CotH kinase family protein [Verrucomicrobiae bacterium]
MLPSKITTAIYTILDKDLVGFDSNLPLIIINTYGRRIEPDLTERVPATMTVIDTKRPSNRARLTARPDYHGRVGIEGRGQTSWMFPKKPYNVELRDENDDDLSVPLLGMPADSDWVLLNLYNDKSFMNDFLAHELFEQMGHYAVRRRYVEVFLNGTRHDNSADPSGKVAYNDYVGIYLLLEKIKIGPNRVNLARLTPADEQEPEISGGYIFKKDKDSPGDISFTTSSGQYLKFHDPKGQDLTATQRNWLVNYINKLESALYGSAWLDPVRGYAQYIDVDSFVDNHWIVEFTKQIDGYRLSNYFQKDRGGRVKMEPIWDWNLSFGNADYLDCQYPQGWYWPLISSYDHIWLRRLIAEPGSADFNQKIVDRWSVLRTNVFNPSRLIARMDQLAAMLGEAQARDFARWPRPGQYVWPNPPGLASATTYSQVLTWVKTWISNRFNWIDSQFVRAPAANVSPGQVTQGTVLSLSAPAGTIWYTLNGSDPRAAGGSVSSSAVRYSA